MERIRQTLNLSALPCLLLLWVASPALADEAMVNRGMMGDLDKISSWNPSPKCVKAGTPSLNQISGAVGLADSMNKVTPERISVNKFCDKVQTHFPDDKLLHSGCVTYQGAIGSNRDPARDLLFDEIKRKPEAGKRLVGYVQESLDGEYSRCMKAQASAAGSTKHLGEMNANAPTAVSQGRDGKSIESNVRYGDPTSSGAATGFSGVSGKQ